MAVQPLSPATDRRLGEPLPHQLSNRTRVHLSPIKSLIVLPCDKTMLCGISVRFQTLFPTDRQVAHALLTRPPLTLLPSKLFHKVRSTWMCYARRQRLSWARIKLSKKNISSRNLPSRLFSLDVWAFALLLFPWVVVSLLFFGINELFLCFSSFVVQFSKSVRLPLSRSALLEYHKPFHLSSIFFIFFVFFLLFDFLYRILATSCTTFDAQSIQVAQNFWSIG